MVFILCILNETNQATYVFILFNSFGFNDNIFLDTKSKGYISRL